MVTPEKDCWLLMVPQDKVALHSMPQPALGGGHLAKHQDGPEGEGVRAMNEPNCLLGYRQSRAGSAGFGFLFESFLWCPGCRDLWLWGEQNPGRRILSPRVKESDKGGDSG